MKARFSSAIGRLFAKPQRVGFFQAVRLLRRHLAGRDMRASDALGDRVQFGNSLALSFPASEIEKLEDISPASTTADAPVTRVKLTPAFIGLTGNQGVLPQHYTERLLEREVNHRDRAARAFLDIFANRSAVQYFGAWEKYRPHFQFEAEGRSRYLPTVLALAGAGAPALQERLDDGSDASLYDETIAYYASILRAAPRSAQSIAAVLSDYFAASVRLVPFVGQWFRLPDESLAQLGLANASLGVDAVCGARIYQRDSRIQIEVGPLSRSAFLAFMPGGASARALDRLLGLVLGPTIEVEVRVLLDRREVQALKVGLAGGGRLGWDSWLATESFERDPDDATYRFMPGFMRGQAQPSTSPI
ncbi:type VI secretion system baseplate subunit TssG [Niveibacterium sp. 24ML]|uniref:type VI secretion system baseplate subunit TssG n=1 Tax=Niveibacterium sp. 24ML TaxID=2985512 RepID=UPI00226E689E|nr:type VI secretion system baseplate subunit TssG [Niveibacterium sp. 24ML]MCX9154822.1 type VI secretion system baseplate subunit TssG [Niveibacterium sp. 24ML]